MLFHLLFSGKSEFLQYKLGLFGQLNFGTTLSKGNSMGSKILLTGDYWHPEFSQLFTGREDLMMVPIDQIDFCKQSFALVVIAQSLPGQFSLEQVERVQISHPFAPVVALLGSWCEGDVRTGIPWPGVQRIYWHQWEGRLESFLERLGQHGITGWHLPPTATVADQILRADPPHAVLRTNRRCVGVSATNAVQFEMLREGIESLGWSCRWIETTPPGESRRTDPICIDTGGIGPEFLIRLQWLKQNYPNSQFIAVTSFPRLDQIQDLVSRGVQQVISKPFTRTDLEYALLNACQLDLK